MSYSGKTGAFIPELHGRELQQGKDAVSLLKQNGQSAYRLSQLALLCLPLLLLAQYVGNSRDEPLWGTVLYLVIFVGCLWFGGLKSRPESSSSSDDSSPAWARWCGICIGLLGAAFYVGALLRLISPELLGESIDLMPWLGSPATTRVVMLLAPWPLGLGLSLVTHRKIGAEALLRIGVLVALGLLAIMASGQTYQRLPLFEYESTVVQGLFWTAAACLAALAVVLPRQRWIWLVGLLLPALALRAVGLDVWSIDPGVRDMLALVTSAHDSFLAGENPYQLHQMQKGSVVPLTYLPGMWLSFLPPRLVGLDIRWMGILADAVLVSSLWWVSWRSCKPSTPGPEDQQASFAWPEAACLAFAAVWLFLPSVHWNGIYAEPNVWWGVLALLLASVALERWWLAAVMLGLAVTMRHFAVIVLPFVVVVMWRALGWRQLVARLSVSGAIAAVLLVPFVAWDPETFWFGTFRWLREYGPAHHTWFHTKFGFAGLFYKNDIASWLTLGQALSVVLCLLGAIVTRADRRRFFGFAGLAYVLFIMFNGLIWYSFYLGAALFVAFAASLGDRGGEQPSTRVTGIGWYASCAVFALSVLAGGWLVYTLMQASTRSGLSEAREFLSANLEPGDTLVDESDWNVEFVKGRPLFEQGEKPRRVRVVPELMGRSTPRIERLFAAPTAPRRLWLVARTSLPDRHIDDFKRLGQVEVDQRFGVFQVIALTPHHMHARLAATLDSLQPSFDPLSAEQPIRMERNLPPAPASPDNPWTATGQPSWLRVAPKRCEMGGGRFEMLYVHPKKTGVVRLQWSNVALGETLMLFGGIESPVVRWDRAPVDVEVRIGDNHITSFEWPNLPGPHWHALPTGQWEGKRGDVEILVSTTDDRQRWTCLDGIVLSSD